MEYSPLLAPLVVLVAWTLVIMAMDGPDAICRLQEKGHHSQ